MELRLLPITALDTAARIAVVVKTVVDLPRHVATVKGLKRYHAAMVVPSHLTSFRELKYSLPAIDTPEFEIETNAFAFTISTRE